MPEDASTGLVPHRAANDASLRILSGLSPGGDEQRSRGLSADACERPAAPGLTRSHRRQQLGVEVR